jgi:cytochrome oxidase Cu insertion factor (SCO1/SenC/PrrC family)
MKLKQETEPVTCEARLSLSMDPRNDGAGVLIIISEQTPRQWIHFYMSKEQLEDLYEELKVNLGK